MRIHLFPLHENGHEGQTSFCSQWDKERREAFLETVGEKEGEEKSNER